MPIETTLVDVSTSLQLALPTVSERRDFQTLTASNDAPAGDGVFNVGEGGSTASRGVKLIPWAHGEPGADFYMRLYAWHVVGVQGRQTWVPMLCAQWQCFVGDLPGQDFGTLTASDRFCSYIYGPDVSAAGDSFLASAMSPIYGARRIQFDFAFGETLPAFPNCLWAFV